MKRNLFGRMSGVMIAVAVAALLATPGLGADELLANPGFEDYTGAIAYPPWKTLGGTDVEAVNWVGDSHGGDNFIRIDDRDKTWDGAQYDIKNILGDNGTGLYVVSAWVRFRATYESTDTAKITIVVDDDGSKEWWNVEGVVSNVWVQLSGTVDLTWTGVTPQTAAWFQVGGMTVDTTERIFVDDVSLKRWEAPEPPSGTVVIVR